MTQNKNRSLIILIGGPPGIGKTTLAQKLATSFGLEIYSTDFIVTIFEFILSPQFVKFMRPPTFRAWKTIKETLLDVEEPIVEGFKRQLILSSIVINSFIKSALGFEKIVILEGVHLVPGYINLDNYDKRQLIYVVLSLDNNEEYKERFYMPKYKERSHTFSMDQHEFLHSIKIKNYIEELAILNNIELINNKDLGSTYEILSKKIKDLIK